jgi:hypothetical protein
MTPWEPWTTLTAQITALYSGKKFANFSRMVFAEGFRFGSTQFRINLAYLDPDSAATRNCQK